MANILAVDDEQPILELIKNGLQKDGHMVTGYVSAEQVPLDNLNRYDLIILDIMMPGLDGFSFCEKIRSMSFGEHSRKSQSFARIVRSILETLFLQ